MMSKKRRTFSSEFKLESAQLVVNPQYSVREENEDIQDSNSSYSSSSKVKNHGDPIRF